MSPTNEEKRMIDAYIEREQPIEDDENPDQCPKRAPGRKHSFVPRDDDPDYVYCEYCGVIES